MSNGWYKLEGSSGKRAPAHIAEFQYREMYRRERPVPAPAPRPASSPAAESAPEPAPPPAPASDPAPVPESAGPAEPALDPPPRETPAAPLPTPRGDQRSALHSQTVGPGGPVVLQDAALHETLEGFVTAKTVERAVHAKGWGAFGHFVCQRPMGEFTCLPFLQRAGQRTDTVSRFSLAVSSRGTPDTSRNVRGFSTKFFTAGGVFDLLCNHIPVFAVRDSIRFPQVIRALSPAPDTNLIDPARFWDFVARAPEATHFVTWLYSDAGTLKSLRRLRAYGVNTYVWKTAGGRRRYVKYHWIPALGTEFILADEAEKLAARDPDAAGRDLREAISRGEFPEYALHVQLMDPEEAAGLPFDPLDDTKVWDEERYPLVPVGRLTLDRNPELHQDQVEKLAFSPNNLLEGAELSADRMLQGRSFIYWTAQRYRLGPDFRSIPINQEANWSPGRLVSSGLGVEASGAQVRQAPPDPDDFTQAGLRYRALSPDQRQRLADNIASELAGAPEETRRPVLGYFRRADPAYGAQVEQSVEERLRRSV